MSQSGEASHTPGPQGAKRDFSEEATSPAGDGGGSSDQNNGKKRPRTTGMSSRGVANLTPDQLAKKRANDREAQRAIRERTKNQIESLERKIKELTSQQPYQELQHVLRQKEAVEQENADIRKRLQSVMGLIQPVLAQPGVEAPTYTPPSQASYVPNRPTSSSNMNNATTPNSVTSPGAGVANSWQACNAPMAQDRNHHQQQQLIKQRHDLQHNLDMGPERLGLDFLVEGNQRIAKIPNGINGTSDMGSPVHHRSNSIGSHVNYHTGNPDLNMAGHAAPIRNCPQTCPLDQLLLNFLHDRQQQAADGVSTPQLLGPKYPSVSSLLNPARAHTSHPLSKVFTDILATFPELSTLPERVAILYLMFLVMRWQISPTQENYDRLPEWATPRPTQLFTAHPAWIDHLPWPKMRDRLVSDYNPRDYLFDKFFVPFTTTISVNWPYEPTDTLLDTGNEELAINPVFERHLMSLENWSLGPAFAKAFPGLQDTYRLKVDGDRR